MHLVMLLASALVSLAFIWLFMPGVWAYVSAVDDSPDVHEISQLVVATRNPVRESGPPACMAKLIMQRHKIHQTHTRRRRSVSASRQVARTYHVAPPRLKKPWIRLTRSFGKQHH